MTRPYQFNNQSNTPAQIAAGVVGRIETIEAYNSNATGAYVKLYQSTAQPDSSAIPTWARFVGQGAVSIPVFADGSAWWIAVATEHAAGLSAPAAAFQIDLTFSPAG